MMKLVCAPFDDDDDGTVDPASLASEARLVHFLRHGEAEHQAHAARVAPTGLVCKCDELEARGLVPDTCPYFDDVLVDAPLTERGRAELRALALSSSSPLPPVQLVLAAASTRAIESALLAFATLTAPPPVLVLEDLRARAGRHAHSRRRARAALARSFPDVAFAGVAHDADPFDHSRTEARASLEARVQRVLSLLFTRPERSIALSTHITTLLALFQPGDDPWIIGARERASDQAPICAFAAGAVDAKSAPALRMDIYTGKLRSFIVERA